MMLMDKASIGRKIRTALQKLGLSQAEFADRIGTSAKSLSSWERGAYLVDVIMLNTIASVSSLTLNDFTDVLSSKTNDPPDAYDFSEAEKQLMHYFKRTANDFSIRFKDTNCTSPVFFISSIPLFHRIHSYRFPSHNTTVFAFIAVYIQRQTHDGPRQNSYAGIHRHDLHSRSFTVCPEVPLPKKNCMEPIRAFLDLSRE